MGVYENIKLDLRKKILGKTWLPGVKMPGTRELAAFYICSTSTIEKSLKDLENEGLPVREDRRGTFVPKDISPVSYEAEYMNGFICRSILNAGYSVRDIRMGVSE